MGLAQECMQLLQLRVLHATDLFRSKLSSNPETRDDCRATKPGCGTDNPQPPSLVTDYTDHGIRLSLTGFDFPKRACSVAGFLEGLQWPTIQQRASLGEGSAHAFGRCMLWTCIVDHLVISRRNPHTAFMTTRSLPLFMFMGSLLVDERYTPLSKGVIVVRRPAIVTAAITFNSGSASCVVMYAQRLKVVQMSIDAQYVPSVVVLCAPGKPFCLFC